MSFQEIETSKDLGDPYDLYEFVFGPNPTDIFKYCNETNPINGYVPIPIEREQYKTSGKAERDQMTIKVPHKSEIAQMILPYPPPYEVTVTCYAGHYRNGVPDVPMVFWAGRVLSNAFEDGTVALTCESTIISLKRLGVRRRWQIGCPLVLYSQGTGQCNANKDDFTVEAEVIALENDFPVFATGWNQPFHKDDFKNGMIKWTSSYGTEYRMIRNVNDDRITFNGILRGIEVGMIMELTLGCNRKMTDCHEIFDNIKNYGGAPWIPLTNPVRHHGFW